MMPTNEPPGSAKPPADPADPAGAAGQINAPKTARQPAISRERHYQWEKRPLPALLQASEQHPAGWPPWEAGLEQDQSRRQVMELQQKVKALKQVMDLRQVIPQLQAPNLDPK